MSEKPVNVPLTNRRVEPLFDSSGMLRRRTENERQPSETATTQPKLRIVAAAE